MTDKITISREWLIKLAKINQQAAEEFKRNGDIQQLNLLCGYIESAKYLLEDKNDHP